MVREAQCWVAGSRLGYFGPEARFIEKRSAFLYAATACEGMMGDLTAADNDLAVAEDFSRKGIDWVTKESPSLRVEYVRPFVRDLQFRAKVLQALGRPDEAQKKLDEAAKYLEGLTVAAKTKGNCGSFAALRMTIPLGSGLSWLKLYPFRAGGLA